VASVRNNWGHGHPSTQDSATGLGRCHVAWGGVCGERGQNYVERVAKIVARAWEELGSRIRRKLGNRRYSTYTTRLQQKKTKKPLTS